MGELEQFMTPTGQIVDLAKPDEVAIAYDDIVRLESQLKEVKAKLRDTLVEHSKTTFAKKSFEIPGVAKIEVKGGSEKKFDAQAIKRELKAAGCPAERISEIVRETIEYKVMAVEARRAGEANEEFKKIIDAHTMVEEKSPSVSVTRIGGRSSKEGNAREDKALAAAPSSAPADDFSDDEKLPWE